MIRLAAVRRTAVLRTAAKRTIHALFLPGDRPMFRWLALCLVLCAGAFALVALATGAFIPATPPGPEPVTAAGPAPTGNDTIEVTGGGLGHSSIVLPQAHLTAIEREEAPSQKDGTILLV